MQLNDSIKRYFHELGLTTKESMIFITLYQHGTQPASTIARLAGYGRVYTYKILQKLTDQGLVASTSKSGVKHFWIIGLDVLQHFAQQQSSKRTSISDQYLTIKSDIESIASPYHNETPKIQLYEGPSQLHSLFDDMKKIITDSSLLSISVFGTHTFQEQVSADQTVGDYLGNLADYIQKHQITVHNHIAQGGLIMEQIQHYSGMNKLSELPAGDDAINIFIIGQTVCVVIYKGHPIGIKIGSPELARALHFVLQQTI